MGGTRRRASSTRATLPAAPGAGGASCCIHGPRRASRGPGTAGTAGTICVAGRGGSGLWAGPQRPCCRSHPFPEAPPSPSGTGKAKIAVMAQDTRSMVGSTPETQPQSGIRHRPLRSLVVPAPGFGPVSVTSDLPLDQDNWGGSTTPPGSGVWEAGRGQMKGGGVILEPPRSRPPSPWRKKT